MGGRKASFESASSGSVPLVWAPLGHSSAVCATRNAVAMDLHPPFGMCGMRNAAHSHEAPAPSGRPEPIEEVA
jgi:hypothetical protein